MKTENLTPKWRHLIPIFVRILQSNGKVQTQQHKDIIAELNNMATAADNWNEHCDKLNSRKRKGTK